MLYLMEIFIGLENKIGRIGRSILRTNLPHNLNTLNHNRSARTMNGNFLNPLSTPELVPGMDALTAIHNSMSGDVDLNGNICRVEAIGNGNVQAGINDIDEPAKTDGVMLDHDSIAPSVTVTNFLFYPNSSQTCYPLNPVVQAVNDFAVSFIQFRSGKLLNNRVLAFLSRKSRNVNSVSVGFNLPFKAGTICQPKRKRQDQNNSDQDNGQLVSAHIHRGLSAKGNTKSVAACRACRNLESSPLTLSA